MKLRVIIAVLMTLCMTVGVFAAGQEEEAAELDFNETGYPIVNEPLELVVKTFISPLHRVSDFNDLPSIQRYEDKTGVRIDWDLSPQEGWNQTLNLMLASGDYPDMLFNGNDNVTLQGAREGIWRPLNDLIDRYAPVIQAGFERYPTLKQSISAPDGKIYALGGLGPWRFQQTGAPVGQLLINTTWLERLDLESPETTEELYEVLVAFRDEDPNRNGSADEIPVTFLGSNMENTAHSFYPFAGMFGLATSSRLIDPQNGELVFAPTTENWKDFVRFLRRLYAEGLLDQETFIHDMQQYRAKGKSEDARLGVATGFSGLNLLGSPRVDDDYTPLIPPAAPGYSVTYPVNSGGGVRNAAYISNSSRYPEVAMRWLNGFAETENYVDMYLGELGWRMEIVEGIKAAEINVEGMSGGESRHARSIGVAGPHLTYPGVNIIRIPSYHANLVHEHMDVYMQVSDREFLSNPLLTTEITEELAELTTNLQNVVFNKLAVWVMEGTMEDEWDTYLRELDNIGLERYLQLHRENVPIVTLEEDQLP